MTLILAGKITQAGTNEPVVTFIHNPCLAAIVGTGYAQQGKYWVDIDTPMLNSDMPARYEIANLNGDKFAYQSTSRVRIEFQSTDAANEPEDGRLTNSLFKIYG